MHIDWTLLKRSITSDISPEEKRMLKEWLEESPEHRGLYRNIRAFVGDPESFRPGEKRLHQFKQDFEKRLLAARGRKKRSVLRYVKIAASFMLPLGIALFLFLHNNLEQRPEYAKNTPIFPGTQKAVLVTSEGQAIALNGELPVVEVADGLKIKNDQNALIYSDSMLFTEEHAENQLIIPRGGEYAVQLSDGTKIWLNSASELKYPVRFQGDCRRVYLKGEAYFRVTHTEKPFIVVTDDIEVKVYGTEFNINTRAGNTVQTTLVKGSVSIRNGNLSEQIMLPDQMAEYNRVNGKIEMKQVDVANYISWKSGVYVFEDRSIEQIMEELSLWYDINVFFRNSTSKTQRFSGSLPRYREIDEMLSVIEKTSRVKFEVKGKTVIIN